MRIATWNVNSIKQRIDNLTAWLSERQPDIVCLQEIKCVDDAFPREPFEALGYNVAVHGQKAFNGVAVLSKLPFDDVTPGLSGDDNDPQSRFLEVVVSTKNGVVRAASDSAGLYTFWDYQAGAWQKNWGLRIDHLLLSPQAADRLVTAGIDKHVRSWEKPSDHVPVYVDLAIDPA